MAGNVQWPDRWQQDVVELVTPYLRSEHLLEVWVGDPASSVDGTLIAGYVYVGEDGYVYAIHDHSARPDTYPWRMLAAPVLTVTARLPGKRRAVIYDNPEWGPRRRRRSGDG